MTTPRRLSLAALTFALAAPLAVHAQAAPQQPGSDPTIQSTPGGGQRGQGRNGMGRGVRGTVTAASGANVTLKTERGDTWTVMTTDNTRINIDRQPVKASDVKAGDEVMAMGIVDQDKHEVHAMMLAGISAAQVAKLKADMGKTYIIGKVTAINDTKLTIERPDHVSQTILLDETTSLKRGGQMPAELMAGGMFGGGMRGGRRGGNGDQANGSTPPTNNETTGGMPQGQEGESITLADVKVGDNVAGTGVVKNGSFVPADFHVLVRQQRGPRAGGGAEGGSSASGPPQR